MDSVLLSPVQLAKSHAIPFRTIFEEHLRREQAAFLAEVTVKYPRAGGGYDLGLLLADVEKQESAYAELSRTYDRIKAGEDLNPDMDLQTCVNADRPLKALLHKTNANALCLSGGGIRSASFCLGVLEGLARISRNAELNVQPAVPPGVTPPRQTGLMDGLDYLSTVSGGGYIGSWLMSWTYRRMAAYRGFPELATALDLALDCTERALGLCLEIEARLPVTFPPMLGPLPRYATSEAEDVLADRLGSLAETIRKGVENAKKAVFEAKKIPTGDPRQKPHTAAAGSVDEALKAANLFKAAKDGRVILARPTLSADLAKISASLMAAGADVKEWQRSYSDVVDAMSDASERLVTGGDPEPQAVRHLRSYTSFLAPELGATLDTSTLAAIILRNLVVNWTMLIPVLFAAIAAVRSSAFLLEQAVSRFGAPGAGGLAIAGMSAVVVLFLLAAGSAAVSLPSHHRVTQPVWLFGKAGDRRSRAWKWVRNSPAVLFVIPVFAGCWLLTAFGAHEQTTGASFLSAFVLRTFVMALVGYGLLGTSIYLAYAERTTGRMLSVVRGLKWVVLVIVLTALGAAAATSAMLGLLERVVFPWLLLERLSLPGARMDATDAAQWLFVVFGLPLVTIVVMASCSLFCAVLGIYEMEEDREWWVRAGGWLLAMDAAWMTSHALTLYGLDLNKAIWTGIAGVVVGAAGSAVGYGGSTSAGTRPVKASQTTKVGDFLTKYHLVLPAVSLVAVVLIAIGMVALEEEARKPLMEHFRQRPQETLQLSPNESARLAISEEARQSLKEIQPAPGNATWAGFLSAMVILGISGSTAVLMNWAININLFSLQGMYRMRLMRAFLGASNTYRRENTFTHFDPADTPHETDLPSAPGAPLHVINTTLNLVGTTNPAWLQRKAESFTFTPIHAGSWRLGYVPASLYGGSRGVTLATAMAISGAAFNPNMGYQSSPLLSLLMTFFNLRLGYWLPNPKRPTSTHWLAAENEGFYSKSGPSFALFPLLEELLGKTDDTSRWIELTDGGHFENLGIYEMVLRRVKRIIVVDAGADVDFQFEDLGNAVRKIQIDLGVPIEFEGRPNLTEEGDLKLVKGMDLTNRYCAVARIGYHCVDAKPAGMKDEDFDGYLIYIKASLTGREPMDVIQYGKTHKDFPHETTANQFFNESQFESYRKLGSFIVKTIEQQAEAAMKMPMMRYNAAVASGKPPAEHPLADPYAVLLEGARRQWKRAAI